MAHQKAQKVSNSLSKGSSSPQTPKLWPSNIIFTDQPVYSATLPSETRTALIRPIGRVADVTIIPHARGPSRSVRITQISDKAHPAHGQCGLFAAQHLPPSTFVLSYIGYVHGEDDTNHSSDYDISLDRETGAAVDATDMGNEARFTNDYRGIGSRPNAEFRDIWVDIGSGKSEKRVGIFVLAAGKAGKKMKGIAKGEEILVSYGKGFWAGRQTDARPHP